MSAGTGILQRAGGPRPAGRIGAPVHVVGATSRPGAALCRALAAAGEAFVPVLRDPARWRALDLAGEPRLADLRGAEALQRALRDATHVVACVHAQWTPAILAAAPPAARLVLTGSTRRFSRWPDAHGDGVRAGEAALLASGRPGIMLHPTMIYGTEGENNVRRLAALLRRLPVAPLPGGGRALVQPIHQDDVARCFLAALRRPADTPEALVIAGPTPLAYRDFLVAVARAAGLRVPAVLPVPAGPLRLLAPLTRLLPGMPRIEADEIRRLTEDKAFDIGPMRARLGVEPMPLAEGLARTFGQGLAAAPARDGAA
ncbi:NAD(P)H-binding protein [Paracraurococcus lichenis]|uniref:NADH-ubiquinone oxidoreductase n=1 Tax=Paracraurococcus lichenis TaxID=3064888 RepID=A0ABT9E0K8_9PROT|nr:NADH-ubiquinone oxidoreductase [Paracraurococcus sp. LOR1-02]MDO9709681.1 NADH-ubiquinone oxidoreductase [Paracraurococcus sp. LOR1-02]